MYGFSGYATNAYGTRRIIPTPASVVIQVGPRTIPRSFAVIQPIVVNQGDFGYELGPWALFDDQGDAQNLTGATLLLNVQDAQDPTDTLLFVGGITVDEAAEGLIHYSVSEGNFPSTGTFLAQVVASFGTEQVSWPPVKIIVRPALPRYNN
jgi:hypothetical protein